MSKLISFRWEATPTEPGTTVEFQLSLQLLAKPQGYYFGLSARLAMQLDAKKTVVMQLPEVLDEPGVEPSLFDHSLSAFESLAEEARALLDSIPVCKPAKEGADAGQPDLLGLRDRALIGIMVYSFARIGAVIQMKVADYFVQGRRRWVRLHEKGGKEHDVPCHHNLDHLLDEYFEAAGIAGDDNGYLFRTVAGKTGRLTDKPLRQQDAYRIVERRAKAAGIQTRIGNHTFRATGITAYLKNSGKLEVAQQIANA